MADVEPTRPFSKQLTSTGAQNRFYRMLGDVGADSGDKGVWREVRRIQKMTLMLYPAGADQSGGITTQVAEVEGAMELDVSDKEGQTSAIPLGTLNSGNRSVVIGHNVRYVRVRVTAGTGAQVGMQAFGV